MSWPAGPRLLVAPLLLVLLGVVGCGGGQPTAAPPPETARAASVRCPDPVMNGIFDWTRQYRTIGELTASSAAVVRVRATDRAQVVEVGGLPFTITDVDVTETIRGDAPKTIRIRQLGASAAHAGKISGGNSALRGGIDLLRPDSSYFLFISAVEIPGEDTTNQYGIVRTLTGLYVEESGQACHLDPESPGLPKALPIDDLRDQVTG
ncbi:hypothetical protein [Frankia sp. QA3]|uniref:hypothetical protein n=1 Tax=Frankia sp. QA3 TaxID=710111 RepID=UPI000269BAE1|nr:hypothetical protein [Frankia sp. QA3]EIV91068.1 hypothetical protein FraQA3DRAFT_0495 [Frankia sp. QA3]